MNKKLRIVLVGCGGMSETWLKVAHAHPDVEIVGLVDIRPEAAQRRAKEIGLPDAVIGTDLKDVLTRTSAEVLFDCTIPEAHFPNAMLALEHGCHVLSEKPMADSMDHARRMVEAAKKSGKIYAVIQNYRYKPGPRRLEQFFRSGRFGNLTTVNADFYIGAHFGGFRDQMEHVLLLDMAIHTFDAARFIIGSDPICVYCKEWNPAGSWYRHGASAVAIFEFANGVVFTYRGSWCAEGLNTVWQSEWRFVAQQGSVRWDGGDGFQAQKGTPDGGFISKLEEVAIPLFTQPEKTADHESIIKEFIACLQTKATPETVCSDNIKSLAMVFGAVESVETGKPVPIQF
jgi:predicted dehydrogenase